MPLAKLHVLEGQYDETRLAKASAAIQSALIEILGIPPDDFFQIHHVLPRNRYLHTPAFLGLKYSDDMILLELTFIAGRPKETRLALLRSLNEKVVAAAGISPDDLSRSRHAHSRRRTSRPADNAGASFLVEARVLWKRGPFCGGQSRQVRF